MDRSVFDIVYLIPSFRMEAGIPRTMHLKGSSQNQRSSDNGIGSSVLLLHINLYCLYCIQYVIIMDDVTMSSFYGCYAEWAERKYEWPTNCMRSINSQVGLFSVNVGHIA